MVKVTSTALLVFASTAVMSSAFTQSRCPAFYSLQSRESFTQSKVRVSLSSVTAEDAPSGSGSIKREKILKEPDLWEYNFGLQDPKLTLPNGIVAEVTPPEKYEITEEQIQTLERDGVIHLKRVFDDDWVDYLCQATAHQVDNPHFWAFAGTASKLYDYIQRNVWQTNKAFARFYYHSAVGHILSQFGRTDEIRVSTDLLMVNPNKGFKWHQDNQNGPIKAEDGLRFWITMDETKEYGAPVYLKGSHCNSAVSEEQVFVDIEMEGLEEYKDKLIEIRTMPGDMLIWHPRSVHKVDGPSDGIWTTYRRVLGGTVAKGNTKYQDKQGTGGVLSDLGRHGLSHGEKLKSPFFPIIYPHFDKVEAESRDNGTIGRSPRDIIAKLGGLAGKASGEKFYSFFQVLGSQNKKQ
uniref:Phytanoyl-CoA dioxygenase n=1 Tax=Corethron hystrix TaxID=216773 RepID=A0A7S1BDK9_9STRA|mmetsp:Transcript_22547/g.51617  ORF Transcript_22547/g.51617 Transcript_22547/m.51617 type:complete len:406 (+) Transcript_22547:585-1802(+)|eukprot:CAMPEP_0113317288 /NCGR_PEP_ID=MMETSP0010_2-20120614/12248_1 /TAXON_ID=216773 ORGANISM="Corethron hystrix, Strain 308" /NCGR_SAMPLE_ID=MMETSP0010_2 /ASSEMBLY_ACC=CAM_ASM_000155 /LENGTH=405 /DNA_ID=CAMNT_0000174223 /DNA_START=433 /DNA_END=1650 /DNA_ORIENTATION=+ /assembly_acc=CAM_ASM_000155